MIGGLLWLLEISGIAAQIVRSTGPAKLSGIEASATKKISAALFATTIMNVKEPGKKKIKLQKRNENNS